MDQKQKNLRPPIVTIMGHVDHGKTTLLDSIRKTNVVGREHGGITQHIGAYQIVHNSQKITFVDTPGHAAFEKMRSRGAEVADIVVLTVAANDGVKPQTTEAIKHIKKANKPIIVAITKVDLPNVNVEKIKKELQGQDVIAESYGGDVPFVEVAAPKGTGLDQLLDVIELVWQISPEESKSRDPLEAVVVESFMDKNRGPIVSVIVKKGTINQGEKIQVDGDNITVRALIDDTGKNVKEAEPSKPVEILGFKKTLDVGSIVFDNTQTNTGPKQAASIEEIIAKAQEQKDKFKIILKADVLGSIEAVLENLPENILIISQSVGEIQPTDVNLAKVAGAPIIAFNVKVTNQINALAQREKILIRAYTVIYKLIEDLEHIAQSFEDVKFEQKIQGTAKIVAKFNIENKIVAGCQVTKGKIKVGDTALVKNSSQSAETKIASIKKFKKEVETVSTGQECGIAFTTNIDFNVGDVIESLG